MRRKHAAKARKNNIVDTGWRLLITPAILLNLGYFILTSIMSGGLNTYLVVALGALHATSTDIANVALTALLAMNAVGVLAGGLLAARTSHHAMVAASGLTMGGIVTALVGLLNFSPALLILLMGISGFCVGATYPSRDMLVRAVTPPDGLWPGLRICQHRLQYRRQHRPDHIRHADGPRSAARGFPIVRRRQHSLRFDGDVRIFAPRNTLSSAQARKAALLLCPSSVCLLVFAQAHKRCNCRERSRRRP